MAIQGSSPAYLRLVVSGHPLLAAAALDAIKQWCYKPAALDGTSIELLSVITVNFVLTDIQDSVSVVPDTESPALPQVAGNCYDARHVF